MCLGVITMTRDVKLSCVAVKAGARVGAAGGGLVGRGCGKREEIARGNDTKKEGGEKTHLAHNTTLDYSESG